MDASMPAQEDVSAFTEKYDLRADPAYRALDLASEVGEIAKECADSTGYGTEPEAVDVASDEVGDALFALLALADELDIDAGEALDESLSKYEERVAETGDPGSGE